MLNKKDFEYFEYIVEHKKNVMIAYNLLCQLENYASTCGCSIIKFDDVDLIELKNRVIKHDISKFNELEFEDYRKCFFPVNKEEKNNGNFDLAWKHHFENNRHHPEYHKYSMNKVDMVEMIFDWCAMSIKFKDNPLNYFINKRDKLIEEFGDKIDFEYVEYILNNLDNSIESYINGNHENIFCWC